MIFRERTYFDSLVTQYFSRSDAFLEIKQSKLSWTNKGEARSTKNKKRNFGPSGPLYVWKLQWDASLFYQLSSSDEILGWNRRFVCALFDSLDRRIEMKASYNGWPIINNQDLSLLLFRILLSFKRSKSRPKVSSWKERSDLIVATGTGTHYFIKLSAITLYLL